MRRTTRKWTLAFEVKGGHRYFRDEETGKIGVADDSGENPELTDDGLLWLDQSRPITLSDTSGSSGGIPLVDEEGKKYGMSERMSAAVIVAKMFGMKIKCGEHWLAVVGA